MAVVVVGSLNTDLVVTTAALPRPGETVTGRAVRRQPGGKGLNQAVAAARAAAVRAAAVALHGAIGADADGQQLLAFLAEEGVLTDGVHTVAAPTGTAIVTVDDAGANSIVVVAGANDLAASPAAFATDDVLLLQAEVPDEVDLAAARAARAAGARVLLNLAPFRPLPAELAGLVDLLVVNEGELTALHGSPDPARAPGGDLVVTVGARGAYARIGSVISHVPGLPVDAVDTTGAGDCFSGCLGAALAEGQDLTDALSFAVAAAALSVTRPGAAGAMPTRAEIDRLRRS